jgi:NADH-quinone oxidoreductase subunit M
MAHFTTSSSFPYIVLLLLVPLLGSLAAVLLPKKHSETARWVGIGASVVTLGLVIAMTIAFQTTNGGYQFVSQHSWASELGISWISGIDGISLFMVGLTALITPIVLLGASEKKRTKSYVAWMLLLEFACIGSFVSMDLILFFLFFELTLIPSYFLIVGWGGPKRAAAATKFFIYTFAGSTVMLVGILYVAYQHHQQTNQLTFSLLDLMATRYSGVAGVLLLVAFTIGFAIKAPVFPFHTWSPDTYGEAAAGTSMMLAAILAKLGAYGMIRFDLSLFPHASSVVAPVMLTLATIGIIYGAVVACAQKDLKRLVAYSSLAQMGFIVLGTFALSEQSLTGAVFLMLSHGIITAAFFLLIGWIAQRRGTWQLDELKGLQGPAPILAALFTVVMLASIGLPGLAGFVGEYLILIGTFVTHQWWALVATFGVVFAAIYLLWAYQRSFQGKAEGANASVKDLTLAERAIVAPLILLIVLLGVFPKPFLDRITPSVDRTLNQITIVNCNPHLVCGSNLLGGHTGMGTQSEMGK